MKVQLREFTLENFNPVRVYADKNNEPWFVAKDVCDALGVKNSRDTLAKSLDEDERGVANIYTPGGPQEMATVSESGFYSLVFASRKDEAKKFRKWVTSEVLPQIRKTGKYAPKAESKTKTRATHDEIAHIITTVAHATRFTYIPNALALELTAEALKRNGFPCHSLR